MAKQWYESIFGEDPDEIVEVIEILHNALSSHLMLHSYPLLLQFASYQTPTGLSTILAVADLIIPKSLGAMWGGAENLAMEQQFQQMCHYPACNTWVC